MYREVCIYIYVISVIDIEREIFLFMYIHTHFSHQAEFLLTTSSSKHVHLFRTGSLPPCARRFANWPLISCGGQCMCTSVPRWSFVCSYGFVEAVELEEVLISSQHHWYPLISLWKISHPTAVTSIFWWVSGKCQVLHWHWLKVYVGYA